VIGKARRVVAAARNRYRGDRLVRRTNRILLPPPPRAWRHYGAGTVVVPPARVETAECIELGDGVVIHEHAWLCVQRRRHLPEPLLRIGDRTSLNRFLKIVVLGRVEIGEDVLLGDRVYISDVEHLPWSPEDRVHPLRDPEPVVIGDRVHVGVGAVVKPGVTIGADAFLGAGAVVRDDVPAGGLVVGDPARLVRLRNPTTGEWERVGANR
jgi:acetyltransferase-like isoleucine patch superfamily enzyme